MALIQWSASLSVNVAEMDKQHQKLVGMINELHDAMVKGKGKEVMAKTISGLMDYTKTHFTDEEKLIDRFQYPESASQKNMHKKFLDKVYEFKKQMDEGKVGMTITLSDFLSDWLKNHIKIEDKKYGVFLNKQGVK